MMDKVPMIANRTFRGAVGFIRKGEEFAVNEKMARRYVEKKLARYNKKPMSPQETKPAGPSITKETSKNPEFYEEERQTSDTLIPLGGGWYQLPDGRKFRGKAEVLQALGESEE